MHGPVLRGFLANVQVFPPLVVTFQFNPESISDNKTVTYRDSRTGLCGTAPGKTYTGGGDRKIGFKVHLHGLEQGTNRLNPTGLDNGISTELAKLRSFLYPASDAWDAVGALADDGGRRIKAPPTCLFGFGVKLLKCVVEEITIKETQFNRFLAPVRAEADISLNVIENVGDPLYEVDKHRRNALAAFGFTYVTPVRF